MTPKISISELRKREIIILPVIGYDGYYADSFGDIWSSNSRWGKWRKLSGFPDPDGYLKIKAKKDGRLRKTAVHKMVCLAWHGDKPPEHEVRHLDGTRTNNCPANLKWGTKSENALDRQVHGTEKAQENGKKSWKKGQQTKLSKYGTLYVRRTEK